MDPVFPFEGYGLLSLSLLLISLLFFIIHAKNLIVHAIRSKQPGRRFPPGPAPLPVLGNLQELGSFPHRSLRELSEIYGPLMYLKLGQIATIVVSSASIAEEVLKTEDKTFCSRPPLSSLRKVFYGGLDIAFTPYNAYLKYAKKICVTELLCTSRVQSFGPIREGEVGILIKTILKNSRSERRSVNNLSEMFLCLLNNITCRQVLGRRFAVEGECGRSRFHDMVTEWTDMMGHFNSGEYFPSLEWINSLSGLQGRFVKNFRSIDAFLNEVVQARMADHEEDGRYIIDALLKIQDDRQGKFRLSTEHVKAILMDLFIAGTDTGAVALEWGMSELIRNPRVMRKAQNEVRSINGVKEVVEEVDLHKLTYLKLVVKEILRLHPPAAFLLPRESRKECQINSYKILSNTKVMINVWAIQRDPRIWGRDAEDFRPERFENSMIELKGQHFEFIPFGSGRRGCPGIAMGTTVVELTLANLLYAFDWSMPEGGGSEELDMDESFGIVIRRESPLFLGAVPCMETRTKPEFNQEGGQNICK